MKEDWDYCVSWINLDLPHGSGLIFIFYFFSCKSAVSSSCVSLWMFSIINTNYFIFIYLYIYLISNHCSQQ
ncbi:hypothetical protein BC830DRAFT_1132347 [Chytriomyces sp. MP71]|nr:hypothetical protein BC830DRAFT_1132347 [Chytriomyces sp. MP71]